MKYIEEDIWTAYYYLIARVKSDDEIGKTSKKVLKDIIGHYLSYSKSKKVIMNPKYKNLRCPRCDTALIDSYDHYCRQCGQKLDLREVR